MYTYNYIFKVISVNIFRLFEVWQEQKERAYFALGNLFRAIDYPY